MRNTQYRNCIAAAFSFISLIGAASGANILRNTDFSLTDGLGGVAGWYSSYNKIDTSSSSGRAVEPGVCEVTFSGPDRNQFSQYPVRLAPGGRYRLSAEVMTAGNNDARISLIIWNHGWGPSLRTEYFPDNTQGKWQPVSWEGTLKKPDRANAYTVGFDGSGSNGTARVLVRKLRLEPLDDLAAAVEGVPERFLGPFPARIVPIDPLLSNMCADAPKMRFFWPGKPACGVAACKLSGSIDGNAAQPAVFGEDGRATLEFGKLKPGTYRMEVKVCGADGSCLASNAYRIVACAKPPKAHKAKRLNNFVTQLVNAPLKSGKMSFVRETDGWTWFSFDDTDDGAKGYLDGSAVPSVLRREGEPYCDGVRFLTAGKHVLNVKGATKGRLRIHAVKPIMATMWPLVDGPCNMESQRYVYTHLFARRFLFLGMNVAKTIAMGKLSHLRPDVAYYPGRGFGVDGGPGIKWSSDDWFDAGRQRALIDASMWTDGYDISIDESTMCGVPPQNIMLAENVWKLIEERPRQSVSVYWGDGQLHWFCIPSVHVSLISALANSGDGRGRSLSEVYSPVLRTPTEGDRYIEIFARQVESMTNLVPAATGCATFNMSPWIETGRWNDYSCPEGDIKAHYARMAYAFATNPRFAANGGLSGGAMPACEEEHRRWVARLYRYYGLEGGTENLADKFGFKWAPGFVKNCDFDRGLDGWEVVPAAGGAVKAGSIEDYGRVIQRRQQVPKGTGDNFAEFTSSASGPNVLRQKLEGLVPGKLYALMFVCADRATYDNPVTTPRAPSAFRARLEGGESLEKLHFIHWSRKARGQNAERKELSTILPLYRYVFRAGSENATLVFEDRAADGSALAPGAKQILNYVIFRPYYTEKPEETDEIAALLAGKEYVPAK